VGGGGEADVGELREACPGQGAMVPLQIVVPLLCGALHVERSQPYLFGLWGMDGLKKLHAMMELWQQGIGAVVLWEPQLVGGGVEDRPCLLPQMCPEEG
jgi:hypothetical protein